jgi:hypothetical protein
MLEGNEGLALKNAWKTTIFLSFRLVVENSIPLYNGFISMHWNVFLKNKKSQKSPAKQYVKFSLKLDITQNMACT